MARSIWDGLLVIITFTVRCSLPTLISVTDPRQLRIPLSPVSACSA